MSPSDPPKQPQNPVPFKPRPRLFYFLLALFFLWLIALIVLYALTVYPRRYPTSQG
jgi:hypothetical protein